MKVTEIGKTFEGTGANGKPYKKLSFYVIPEGKDETILVGGFSNAYLDMIKKGDTIVGYTIEAEVSKKNGKTYYNLVANNSKKGVESNLKVLEERIALLEFTVKGIEGRLNTLEGMPF